MRETNEKSTLDSIASQNQLDKMVQLVPSGVKISIPAAFIIVAGLLLWGFFGSIPTSLDGAGIYMCEEGITGQYSNSSGVLIDVYVEPGDYVEQDDTLVSVGDDEYYRLAKIDERIAFVENITFDSDFDTVTEDTEQLAEIKRKANELDSSVESSQAELDLKREKLAEAEAEAEQKKNEMLAYKEQYFSTFPVENKEYELMYSEGEQDFETNRSNYEQAKSAYISAEENYYQAKTAFDAKYKHFEYDSASETEQREYDEALANVQAAADQAEDYSILMEDAESSYNDANDSLDQVRQDYVTTLNTASGENADNIIAQTEYSELLNSYTTALSQFKQLSSDVSDLEIKAVVERFNYDNEYEGYSQQFDNQKASVLSSLERERNDCLNEITKNDVKASISGYVYRVETEPGSAVSSGQRLVALIGDEGKLDTSVICYVPVTEVSNIEAGQEVHICPMGLDSNEYGHMLGKVREIGEFIESTNSMMSQIDSEELVSQFTEEGAVIKVICDLQEDPDTASGYKWSAEKGKTLKIQDAGLMNVTFITDQKRPIDVFIPYIKEKLEFNPEEEDKK